MSRRARLRAAFVAGAPLLAVGFHLVATYLLLCELTKAVEMGEHPPLSDEEIMAINLGRLRLESGLELDTATITAEFLGHTET